MLLNLSESREGAGSVALPGSVIRMGATETFCLMCRSPAASACCSTDCLRAAARERDNNLRTLRRLRGQGVASEVIADLTRRNAELTGAMVTGLRSRVSPPVEAV